MTEIPLCLDCVGNALVAIVHRPETARSCGVLIIVGGPQYRVGSHRQFVLLARYLARHGVPVTRFDYRGMGDSQGNNRSFDCVEQDIATAVESFVRDQPGLTEVVLWGLCDAASAAAFYAASDDRIKGLVLLNPWVHTERSSAKTYLKHYYLQRWLSPELWRKISRGQFEYKAAAGSLVSLMRQALMPKRQEPGAENDSAVPVSARSLPDRMLDALQAFDGPVLLILSGQDFTADEFRDLLTSSSEWQRLIEQSRVTRQDLPAADHTFSRQVWRQQVEQWTLEWVESVICR